MAGAAVLQPALLCNFLLDTIAISLSFNAWLWAVSNSFTCLLYAYITCRDIEQCVLFKKAQAYIDHASPCQAIVCKAVCVTLSDHTTACLMLTRRLYRSKLTCRSCAQFHMHTCARQWKYILLSKACMQNCIVCWWYRQSGPLLHPVDCTGF